MVKCPAPIVAGPGEVGVGGGRFALRAQDIQRAVEVEVTDHRRIVERFADGLTGPVAARRAGILVPPAAGDDVPQAIAVEVAGDG